MAAGLQCWNSAGTMTLDLTSRISKFFGVAQVGNTYTGTTTSGTITDSRFTAYSGHTTFAFILGGSIDIDGYGVELTISGTTLTWNFPRSISGTPSTRPDTTFIYGIA